MIAPISYSVLGAGLWLTSSWRLGWDLIHLVQAEGLVDQFRQVISSFIVNDGIGGGRGLDPIPNPVTGPDWVSGGTFFIRNRRQPRLYWFLHTNKHSSHFHASEEGRTKFKIELAKTTRQQRELEVRGQLVLVRDDLVKVSIVAETTTSSAVLRDKMTYLGVATTSSANGTSVRKLAPVRDEHQWTFGQFLCGSVGVIWEPETAIDGVLENTPVLTYVTKEGADEWELC